MPGRLFIALMLIAASGCDDDLAPGSADTTTGDSWTPDTQEVDAQPDTPPDTSAPDELRLTAVEPSEGKTSGLQEVYLTGSRLLDVAVVLFGDTPALDPFAVNDGLLVALSPPRSRGLVDVTVVTADGERATLPLAFQYADPVQLTAIAPESGHWLGGEPITLSGAGFTEDAVVLIGGRVALAVRHVDDNTLTAVTPAGTLGKADVYVSTSEGIGRIPQAFEYLGDALPQIAVELDGIAPAHGPAAGGSDVVVSGKGFMSGAVVRIGALPATHVVVESSNRITARTAPGSPGAAAVRVLQNGGMAELEDAFVYDGPPAVWVVDPPQGAIAGNTRVIVRGHGFPTTAALDVRFAGALASDVEVLDERTISCRTPAGVVGLAEVRVEGGGITASHPRGFSYFDPAATPGTWGEAIAGNLNITVQDARAGTRLAGATVVVGPDTFTPLRGMTDDNGQITFSDPSLAGRQTVTASVGGYQIFQLAGFDAENVTLPLERIPKCSDLDDMPCEQVTEPPPIAFLIAHIVGSEKGPTVPFGECRDWTDAPNGLCQSCVADSDCGGTLPAGGDGAIGDATSAIAPAICRELGDEGAFCSFGCVSNDDCPGEFVCLDPSGMELEKRCVPPMGLPVAYCDQTEPDMWSDDSIPYPGVRVPESKIVQVGIHLGDFALFCWSGVEVRGDFRPQFLGVTRNLGAYTDGATVDTEVHIDIPLTQRVEIQVDKPADGLFGEEMTVVQTALNLGGDGVLAFPTRRGFLTERFVLYVPEALTGDLYDATWEQFVQIDVAPLNGGSALYQRGLDRLDRDLDYVREDGAWSAFPSPPMTTNGLATWNDGGGAETVVAVGEEGAILKRYGGTWAYMSGVTDRELVAIAVAPSGDAPPAATVNAIAVGHGGVAAHWDGLTWHLEETGTPATLEAVSFGSATVAWAVAGPRLLRWDGSTWSMEPRTGANLHGVLATGPDEVIAVGDGGMVVTGANGQFADQPSGFAATLRALTRTAGGVVIAVGDGGTVLRREGLGWVSETSGSEVDLTAVWARGDEVWAVGSRGTILHRDASGAWSDETVGTTRGTLRAVAGSAERIFAMGSHELIIGPLVGIPENLVPAPGGTLNDRLSWTARKGLDPHFSLIEFDSEIGPCTACGFMFMLPYSEWRTVLHGDLFEARFPSFSGIPNTVSLGRGVKSVTLYRVRSDDSFEFDHTATTGFFGGTWRAWSWRTEAFIH